MPLTQHVMAFSNSPRNWVLLNAYSIIAGLLGGLASIVFRLLIKGFVWLFQGQLFPHITWYIWGVNVGWILLPILGVLLSLPIIIKLVPETQGSGIPNLMYAVTLNRAQIKESIIPAKLLVSSLTLACGGSAGKEGPSALIGGALGAWLGKLLKLSPFECRILIAAGLAGAVGGTFNAPLGGSLFGLELLFHGIGLFSIIPLFLASAMGTTVNILVFGDVVEFPVYAELS